MKDRGLYPLVIDWIGELGELLGRAGFEPA